jgi:hypothetical protein
MMKYGLTNPKFKREGISVYKMRAARPFQESCLPLYFPFLLVLKKINDRKYIVSQVYDYQNRIRRLEGNPIKGEEARKAEGGGVD